ncbi:hypothetical protein CS0771_40600 [Catellatospora sp. IY07-71]|uniref:ATP-binding protein n=1 Tax=Catellatospora sp. IY07-71 TaxID=2728827 RepID=UPI001BB396D9|nr:ATP-binding protein [Catellatospora sp. IY07-71]BCJ74516.1 hypothetical protein CS0771_40600 [Catellatospora sp. IY07-71]
MFGDFDLHRLTRLPRPPRERRDDAEGRRDELGPLAASLAGAHPTLLAAGPDARLATAWLRVPHDPRLHVVLGGRPGFPPATGAPPGTGSGRAHPVLFPPGAEAARLAPAELDVLLGLLPHWVPCAAWPDALWAPADSARERPQLRRGSFDQHVGHLPGSFGWLVLARPLPPAEVKQELDRLVAGILPLTRGEVGEEKRIQLERAQARHRELSRAQHGGAWHIQVLAGGVGEPAAAAVAGLLCAAAELDGLPYTLAPAGPAALLAGAVRAGAGFTAGTELLAALTRPPRREMPGLHLVEPHTFDVTAERREGPGIGVGQVLDEGGQPAGELTVPRDVLNRHTFVCGATGAGKSQTVRHLLTEATRAGLPWLVIEPAKAEYARMAARLAELGGEVLVLKPGEPGGVPAGFNPLRPAPDFPLQTHVDLVRSLFLAAFEAQEPFPQLLAAALTRSYEELGWDLTLGAPAHPGPEPRYPTLGDLQRVAESVVDEIGYGREVTDNVRGFIKVRLGSLRLGTTGRFFEGGHPLDFALLRARNVVMEIEDVGDDADKAFFIGAVLLRLTEHLRVLAKQAGGRRMPLSHLTVIEEAHRLLRRTEPGAAGPARHAVEAFASLLAEVRAYGEGLIVVEQIPSKLAVDVVKNTALKIVHRLPAADDRESVGATMNVDEDQSRQIVSLPPGRAAVFADGMDRPLLVSLADGSDVEERPHDTTGPAALLSGRRSPTCGQECHARACTLLDMRTAQRLLRRHPWLTLWAEAVVVAHLAGHRPPSAHPDQLLQLAVEPTREVDCAISHAVDGAVAVRTAALRPGHSPDGLAGHCVDALRAALTGTPVAGLCAADDYAHLAAVYRWVGIKAYLEEGPADGPRDPRTGAWERDTGRRIPGETRREQRAAVIALRDLAHADVAACDLVAYGALRPSALETALGATRTDPAWTRHVELALPVLLDAAWLPDLLSGRGPAAPPGDQPGATDPAPATQGEHRE